MIVVLIGYPGSQKIVKASRWLTGKYLKPMCVIYLNYVNEIGGWARYVSAFLSFLQDEHIIFALDDYLIADDYDKVGLFDAMVEINKEDVACVKLCKSTPQEHFEYPITTQYCIWKREYLISLLRRPGIETPWEFEITGSKIFKMESRMSYAKKVVHIPCLKYFTNSSISARWEGVRLDGLKEEDIKELKQLGYV